MLIDTHTHIYLREFETDRDLAMQRAFANRVEKFYLPAIDSSHTAELHKLEADFPGKCFAMVGLHPCSVTGDNVFEIDDIKSWLSKRSFAAIGEIGLDFHWSLDFKTQQYECFETQIGLAIEYQLPIVIHSRNATRECIDMIKPYVSQGLSGIFHCFGGSLTEAYDIISCGFMLGIGGVLTYKNSGLDKILKDIPLSNIVLETDAPYLTPVPFRGKRNESSYLLYIAQKLAEVKDISLKEVEEQTTKNANQIFLSKHSL